MGCEAGTPSGWYGDDYQEASLPPGHSVMEATPLRRDHVHSCQKARLDSQRGKGSPKTCGSFGGTHTSCAPGSSSVTPLNKASIVLSNKSLPGTLLNT